MIQFIYLWQESLEIYKIKIYHCHHNTMTVHTVLITFPIQFNIILLQKLTILKKSHSMNF